MSPGLNMKLHVDYVICSMWNIYPVRCEASCPIYYLLYAKLPVWHLLDVKLPVEYVTRSFLSNMLPARCEASCQIL